MVVARLRLVKISCRDFSRGKKKIRRKAEKKIAPQIYFLNNFFIVLTEINNDKHCKLFGVSGIMYVSLKREIL